MPAEHARRQKSPPCRSPPPLASRSSRWRGKKTPVREKNSLASERTSVPLWREGSLRRPHLHSSPPAIPLGGRQAGFPAVHGSPVFPLHFLGQSRSHGGGWLSGLWL